MNAVVIDHVTKTFGPHTAVDDLCLEVPSGCIYGFLGPNGSGKTTTLRMIMRILHPDHGTIRVLGSEDLDAASDQIGYLPEERGLYRKMTVRTALRFYAELKGCRDSRAAIDHWLERLGLTDWGDRRVEVLSKGMSQKVQFIATVVARPPLVLLDEPFSGLDPVNRDVLREAVLDLKRDGATVIFSTHDMAVAETLCDFLFMIYKGRKVLDGTLEAIQDRYGSDTIRVRLEGNGLDLSGVPGVVHVTEFGRLQELRLEAGSDPQQVLAALMSRSPVRHFELARPSLHDIFVRIARPEMEAPNMRKVFVIAVREYNAAVRTKAFLVSLIFLPILMLGSFAMQALLRDRVDTTPKHFAVIDRTQGEQIFAALQQAAAERNEKELRDSSGRQVQPEYVLEKATPADDSEKAIKELRWSSRSVCAAANWPVSSRLGRTWWMNRRRRRPTWTSSRGRVKRTS